MNTFKYYITMKLHIPNKNYSYWSLRPWVLIAHNADVLTHGELLSNLRG